VQKTVRYTGFTADEVSEARAVTANLNCIGMLTAGVVNLSVPEEESIVTHEGGDSPSYELRE